VLPQLELDAGTRQSDGAGHLAADAGFAAAAVVRVLPLRHAPSCQHACAHLQEAEQYTRPQIARVLPELKRAEPNEDKAWKSPTGYVFPPFMIMERGSPLSECAPCYGCKFNCNCARHVCCTSISMPAADGAPLGNMVALRCCNKRFARGTLTAAGGR
jgi:hypothetical protein